MRHNNKTAAKRGYPKMSVKRAMELQRMACAEAFEKIHKNILFSHRKYVEAILNAKVEEV